ncbi:dihydrolipoamide acetyltransferase family protein [Nesterenkonia halophila]|uniref:dihydrolipoamide acetyltransferase family protein n=1 Tax=Nesterenkonia halophila TaxID=302044 RepID=UPI00129139C8|nr:dihydrolipoamide acetyltransferase family protein [Nesterenkonia halophila]
MVDTFNLPDVGEGLTEAEVVSWRVAVGDTVAVNDIVVEIETAKSLVELPVPFAGEVRELVVAEGETIEVGSPLIRIRAEGADDEDDADDAEDAEEAEHDAGSTTSTATAASGDGAGESRRDAAAGSSGTSGSSSGASSDSGALTGSGPKADAPRRRPRTRHADLGLVDDSDLPPMPAPAGGVAGVAADQPRHGRDLAEMVAKASPPVRALAKRLGVAVWELVGSGREGQVTRDDVERRAQQKKAAPGEAPAEPTTPPEPAFNGKLRPDAEREERIAVRGVRKATAANVTDMAQNVPHVSVFKEIDVSRTMEVRAALRQDPSYEGLSVSPMLFAAKAIIWAARRNPQINSSWHESHYVLKNYVNLGIAAATPRGLVVPVIHEAQTFSTRGLAAAITQLTVDAREGRTTPAEMQGGTLSITNIGPLGLDGGTPILPPGQSAIVALGQVRKKPWVVDGHVVPRDVMTIGGSFDHRLIDGEHAGRFITDVGSVLEEPGLLID